MDNLTHSLTGVLLARAGLNRLVPRGTLLCAAAANIPDIDAVSMLDSGISYLNHHRHITHSLPAVPLMAALALALVELPARWLRPAAPKTPWGRGYAVAFIAALTHPLLDLTNTYGVRLWLPFSAEWTSLDSLFIIEPWLWAALLICTFGASVIRLVNREIGAGGEGGRRLAAAGLALLVLFAGGKFLLHARAVETLNAHVYSGRPPLRIAAFPDPLDPWSWRGFVETARYYLISSLDLRREYRPEQGSRYYKPRDREALEAARQSKAVRDYLRFARYAFARVERTPERVTLRYADFRFGRESDFGFRCTVTMTGAYRILSARFDF